MTRESVRLGDLDLPLRRGRDDAFIFNVETRQSQQGDPGASFVAEWRVDGPDLTSFEVIPPGALGGYLGRDYGEKTDGRALGVDQLGPLLQDVDLSGFDTIYAASLPGTSTFKPGVNLHLGGPSQAANANGMAVIRGPSAIPYGYVIRGNTIAKLSLVDFTLKRSGEQLAAPASSVIVTEAAGAVRELSVGMRGQPYRVLTGVTAPPNSDVWVENSAAEEVEILGAAPDRTVGLAVRTAKGNILTGSITMASPNWNTVATIAGEDLRMTGFALDGSLWVIGTSNGPYMLDSEEADFFPIIDEIDNDDENCKQMGTWFPVGVVIPLRDGTRRQKNAAGSSFGPEQFTAY